MSNLLKLPVWGLYIVLEGVYKAGKTTQIRLLYEYLRSIVGEENLVFTREPGGDVVAERARELVQGELYDGLVAPHGEVLFYAAARAQVFWSVILPALRAGKLVVSDRNFVSSLAFQSGLEAIDFDHIWEVNRYVVPGRSLPWPDHILYLNLPPSQVETRALSAVDRGIRAGDDRHENKGPEFVKHIYNVYGEIAELPEFTGSDRRSVWHDIDAIGTVGEVASRIQTVFERDILNPESPNFHQSTAVRPWL